MPSYGNEYRDVLREIPESEPRVSRSLPDDIEAEDVGLWHQLFQTTEGRILTGAVSGVLLLILLLVIIFGGDDSIVLPPDLKARSDLVCLSLMTNDLKLFTATLLEEDRRSADELFNVARNSLANDLLHDETPFDIDTEWVFENPIKGKACLIATITSTDPSAAPSEPQTKNTVDEEDPSLAEKEGSELLLYWSLVGSDGWMLDGKECLKAVKLSGGDKKWSGRAADKRNTGLFDD